MQRRHIHITGASGSGSTTLGRAVADALALPHHDSDDYFWLPTNPPYQKHRPRPERLRLMREMFVPRPTWVLSGSLAGCNNELVPELDLVIFLTAPCELRLARLRTREATHFGANAVAPGGWHHQQTAEFLEWASRYEAGDREGRTLALQEAWLAKLPCPTLRLDGSRPLQELVAAVRDALPARPNAG